MKNKKIIFYAAIIFIILMPVIFFPVSTDLSIYILAGKSIAEGGKIYVDFVDLKTPMIYYIFSGIYQLFGSSEITLRIIDFLIQFCTILALYFLLVRHTKSSTIALASCIIYSISYTVLNFSQTFRAESFVGMGVLLLSFIQLSEKKGVLLLLVRGIIIGFLAGLKLTFGILLIAVIFDDIVRTRHSFKDIAKFSGITALGTSIMLFIAFLPFLDSGIWHGYKNAMHYLSFYASQPPFDIGFIRNSLKELGYFFGDRYSLLLVFLTVYGLSFAINNENKFRAPALFGLINILVIISGFLLISVLLEKKLPAYHFLRMYLPLSILAGLGCIMIINKLKKRWKDWQVYSKLIFAGILFLAALLSPLPRWLNTLKIPVYYFTDKEKYDMYFERSEGASTIRKQHKEVAEIINREKQKNDKVIVMSIGANVINYFLEDVEISKFSQSCFYFSNGSAPEWKKDIVDEVNEAQWIIVQINDRHIYINGHNRSSWESLKQDLELPWIISKNFVLYRKTKSFYIYRRKE